MKVFYLRLLVFLGTVSIICLGILFLTGSGVESRSTPIKILGFILNNNYKFSQYIFGILYLILGIGTSVGMAVCVLQMLYKKQDLNKVESKRIIIDLVIGVISVMIGAALLNNMV